MEYALIIHVLAAEDMVDIARWYDVQMPGLGNRFEKYLDQSIEAILAQPLAHPKATATTRKTFLKKFPYIIFFEVKETSIYIYGVMHSRRNPKVMKERYRKIKKSNL